MICLDSCSEYCSFRKSRNDGLLMKSRITRNILLSLLLPVFVGCAFEHQVDVDPAYKQVQREAFSKLKMGDSRESVLKALSYEISERRSILVDENLMQLDEVYNVATRRKFGLLFLGRKLAAIVDEPSLRQFSDCRWTAEAERRVSWLQYRVQYKDWLLRKDLLGSDFDFGVSNTEKQQTTTGNVAMALGYAPIALPASVVVLPIMGIQKLTGKMDRDAEASAKLLKNQQETRERIRAELERAVSLIEIGDSPEMVASKAGEIKQVIQSGGVDFYKYLPFPDETYYVIGLGFKEGKLILLEYPEHTGSSLLYWSQHGLTKDKRYPKESELASCPDRS